MSERVCEFLLLIAPSWGITKKERQNLYIEKNIKSSQKITRDSLYENKFIEPYINFNELLACFYANVYHRRAIRLKAGMLSQIDTTTLDKFMPNTKMSPKKFVYAFLHNLEIYGTAACEKAGTTSKFVLFNVPGHELILDKDGNIYQKRNNEKIPLDGELLTYYSPMSRFYGEPDYLATLLQISSTHKADRYNDKFFQSGARPDMAIIYENGEPNTEQINAFKEFFGSNFKGVDNAHKTLILHASDGIGDKDVKIRFEELGRVQDLSFKNLKEVNRDEIAAAHGVPPRLLGIIQSGQLGGGSELMSQLHMFNEIEIKPKIEIIEEFFGGMGIKLSLKAIDATNFKDDSDVVTNLVQSGIININEARSILGWQKNLPTI